MNRSNLFVGVVAMLVFFLYSCQSESGAEPVPQAFDSELWQQKVDGSFPHRPAMLEELVYGDTLRPLSRDGIIKLLGSPTRQNGDYLYYEVDREEMGFMTLHATTLVVEVTDSLNRVLIHE